MDEQLNYLGAAIFWLYILAALLFTSIILKTLYDTEPAKHAERNHVVLFGALSACSFATLSYNMLNVLISSYTLWAHERSLSIADTSIGSIWQWSITSTLFHDFGNAIVQSSARYLWTEASLLATLCVCLFTGIEGSSYHSIRFLKNHADLQAGQHQEIPRRWAFIVLGQILPVSFTQNLFYIALLRQGRAQSQWLVSRTVVVLFSGAYCACLIIAPVLAGSQWLIPHILLARSILVAMQVYKWPQTASARQQSSTSDATLLDRSGLCNHLALLTTLCGFAQASPSFLEETPTGIARALFSHPAVSSLGCDFILSSISYICWRSISNSVGASKVAE